MGSQMCKDTTYSNDLSMDPLSSSFKQTDAFQITPDLNKFLNKIKKIRQIVDPTNNHELKSYQSIKYGFKLLGMVSGRRPIGDCLFYFDSRFLSQQAKATQSSKKKNRSLQQAKSIRIISFHLIPQLSMKITHIILDRQKQRGIKYLRLLEKGFLQPLSLYTRDNFQMVFQRALEDTEQDFCNIQGIQEKEFHMDNVQKKQLAVCLWVELMKREEQDFEQLRKTKEFKQIKRFKAIQSNKTKIKLKELNSEMISFCLIGLNVKFLIQRNLIQIARNQRLQMSNSTNQKHQGTQKKKETLKLSKKHLLQLFQTKKTKTAKEYIIQLKNCNPTAQKIVKQALEEVFCQRKVSSPTAYLHALVFYKNLLVSGQLNYFEDFQFFPQKIHDSISEICQYNQTAKKINLKAADYFRSYVKIQNNPNNNQDLDAIVNAIIIFAMELIQSMAEWYKEDYFTGEDSRFLKKYNYYRSKGIEFPKKQAYIYIKDNDKKQFETNYKKLLQAQGEIQNSEPKSPQKQQKNLKKQSSQLWKQTNNYTKPSISQKNQKKPFNSSQIPQLKQSEIEKSKQSQIKVLKEQNDIKQQNSSRQNISKPQQNQIIVQNNSVNTLNKSSINSKTIPKQIQSNTNLGDFNSLKKSSKLNLNELRTQYDIKSIENLNKPSDSFREILSKVQSNRKQNQNQVTTKINQNTKKSKNFSHQSHKHSNQTKKNIKNNLQPQKKDKLNLSTHKIPQQIKQNPLTPNKVQASKIIKLKKNEKQEEDAQIKKEKGQKNIVSTNSKIQNNEKEIIGQKKSLKRTEQSVIKRSPQKSFDYILRTEESQAFEANFNYTLETKNTKKHKHRIFETLNSSTHSKINHPQIKQQISHNQKDFPLKLPLQNINENILHENLSFSPKFSIPLIRDQIRGQSQKKIRKSLPKTQKKPRDRSFFDIQQLGLTLNQTQNTSQFNKGQKNTHRLPIKTLSSWRCERLIMRDLSPHQNSKQEMFAIILQNLKLKQIVLPFIPEYFLPLTLKMSALRRSALQIWSFCESSQVFFNNKLIEARLMKPSRNSYILSLLNVSKSPFRLSLHHPHNTKYTKQIRFIANSVSSDHKITLDPGSYMDIKFMFQTCDLNFKFLPLALDIDSKILLLQLPITLLDQCIIQKDIQVDEFSFISKKSAKIIKSQTFRINKNDLPRFLRKEKQSFMDWKYSSKGKLNDKQSRFFQNFTVRMIHDKQIESTLYCWLSEVKVSTEMYELSILFDSRFEQTQNLTKVMTELMTFLLNE